MTEWNYKALLIPLLMPLIVMGCAGRTTVPDDHFYQLPEILPAIKQEAHLINGTLGIAPLRSDGLHRERAILYVNSDHPLELHRYRYHHWTDSPPRLVQESLLKYLRETRIAANVSRHTPGMQADGLIRGRLAQFKRIIDNNDIKVSVTLELEYGDQHNPGANRLNREYSALIPLKDSSLHSSIEGFGKALQQIYDAFLEDMQLELK